MKRRERSIFRKMFLPVLCLLVLQTGIFMCFLWYGGVMGQLAVNAYDIFSGRVSTRQSELENRFNLQWTAMDGTMEALERLHETLTVGGADFYEQERQREFLRASSAELIELLRNNNVSGVFVILNDGTALSEPVPGESQSKNGLCIRDLDPNNDAYDSSDLLLQRAPASLISTLGISLDSFWQPNYEFADGANNDYFYRPMQAAFENPGVDPTDLAYFCPPHHVTANDTEVVSYSVPLIGADGLPYGVLGVEIGVRHLASLLPSSELADDGRGAYVLATTHADEPSRLTICASSGVLVEQEFGQSRTLTVGKSLHHDCSLVESGDGTPVVACVRRVKIYNDNTPFEDEELVLVGLERRADLMQFSRHMGIILLGAALASLLIGVLAVLLFSYRFTSPITALSQKVRQGGALGDQPLDKLGITEIDHLIDSIDEMSRSASANAAKTDFLSRMSHDMRTPMNAIIGFSDPAMIDGASEAQKDEYLQKINSAGQYLLSLINDVLDMSKIESNTFELRAQPQSLTALVEEIDIIIGPLARRKGVAFSIEKQDVTVENIQADRLRLTQVLVNLLNNAVKFTPAGHTVRFAVQQLAADGARVHERFVVQDTGIGVSAEFLPKMFEPFTQENKAHDGANEGTGLGLAIVKNLVDAMKGSVSVESEPGRGTTFTVDIWFDIAAEAPTQRQPETARQNDAQLAGRRVLLCEDHPLNTQIVVKLLEKKQVSVTTAENGQQGVQRFAQSPVDSFDAILMDVKMPVLDGLQAARQIRALPREDAQRVPIIAMTANAFAEDREQSRQAGMNAHLAKPVDPQLLYATLARLLKEAE